MPALLPTLLDTLSGDTDLFGPSGACPTSREDGAETRVLLVSGGNAGGKSLACRYMSSVVSRDGPGIEFMRVGMGMRTESGIRRAVMFGDEDRESTGAVSGNVVLTGIRTCEGREGPHVLCLDEPDVGLSEEMQDAMGRRIVEFAENLPTTTRGLIVVTHARPLARRIMALDPLRLRVGDDLRSTAEWLEEGPRSATVDDLEALSRKSSERYQAVHAVLQARKAGRSPAR